MIDALDTSDTKFAETFSSRQLARSIFLTPLQKSYRALSDFASFSERF